ncbi:hypothetical protein TraAM80_10288, partial [Trypanosoma rangeli]
MAAVAMRMNMLLTSLPRGLCSPHCRLAVYCVRSRRSPVLLLQYDTTYWSYAASHSSMNCGSGGDCQHCLAGRHTPIQTCAPPLWCYFSVDWGELIRIRVGVELLGGIGAELLLLHAGQLRFFSFCAIVAAMS